MGECPSSKLTIKGIELVAMFQAYESDGDEASGELLTRPESVGSVESYFDALGVADQFEILFWHLELAEELGRRCGAKVSINIHNSLIEHGEDRERFLDVIGRQSSPVIFEFTEAYPMPPVATANRLLRRIRELGHSSALDDFGTGYNGISLLAEYDFDVVKFDRSLSVAVTEDSEGLRALRLLRQIIEELGKQHVVEGVESEEVHRLLREAGFTTFQGHLFHHPVAVGELLENCEAIR